MPRLLFVGIIIFYLCVSIVCVIVPRMTIKKPKICAIAAVGPNNVIGRDGVMPWHCASDLYHFRKMTLNNPCIFGRITFENLPVKPLPDRLNLVCSSSYKNEYKNGVIYAKSIIDAIGMCDDADKIFICGGAGVYKYAFDYDLIDIMYLTVIRNPDLQSKIKSDPDKYTRFPVDISNFFDFTNWTTMPIMYLPNYLPKDTNGTTARFFKSVRVR